jgi:uncharacterized membrane protein YgdD (TMEM256/DUF423 family)
MERKIIITALAFGFLAIVLGAFGAHALKKVLNTDQLNSFEVGVRYLMYHALFLLFVGTMQHITIEQKMVVFYLTVFGTILFSGSIFFLTTMPITKLNVKFLGPITPIGGLLLLAAWFWLFIIYFKKN